MMLLLRWAPIVIEFLGAVLVWLDTQRIGARNPPDSWVIEDKSGYGAWYYHRADLGFALLLFGILMQGASLALEQYDCRFRLPDGE
jgi:hypothetical protein